MDLSSLAQDSRASLDHPVRVAVDAMGGDHGPAIVVEGAVAAAREFGASVVLVGDRTAPKISTVQAEAGVRSVAVGPAHVVGSA